MTENNKKYIKEFNSKEKVRAREESIRVGMDSGGVGAWVCSDDNKRNDSQQICLQREHMNFDCLKV